MNRMKNSSPPAKADVNATVLLKPDIWVVIMFAFEIKNFQINFVICFVANESVLSDILSFIKVPKYKLIRYFLRFVGRKRRFFYSNQNVHQLGTVWLTEFDGSE